MVRRYTTPASKESCTMFAPIAYHCAKKHAPTAVNAKGLFKLDIAGADVHDTSAVTRMVLDERLTFMAGKIWDLCNWRQKE